MNELLFAKYLQPKINIVHRPNIKWDCDSFYGIKITNEFSEDYMLASYHDVYLLLPNITYQFYDCYKSSPEQISSNYAHSIITSQKINNFVNFEVWVVDKDSGVVVEMYNKYSDKTNTIIDTLINDFKEFQDENNEFVMRPKFCFSKYKTMEYMQYKYVNDREIKEWVGSATIIDNGIHSPKKTVKAGHIIDRNKVVHQLYMNDYILRASEDNVFVIVSEDVFNRLFEHYDDGESFELIHNKDDEGCLM